MQQRWKEQFILHAMKSSRLPSHDFLWQKSLTKNMSRSTAICRWRECREVNHKFVADLAVNCKMHIRLFFISSNACPDTLLKPKRHSLRCHGFVVHALLLRMYINVADFRVMRRLCHRELNWQSVNHIPGIYDNGPRDHGVWRLTLTAYCICLYHTPLSLSL